MSEPVEFRIRVDGGEPMTFRSRHSQYRLAALEAFGALGLPYPCSVEIWAPHLVAAGNRPLHYVIDDFVDMHGHRYGSPAVMIATTGKE